MPTKSTFDLNAKFVPVECVYDPIADVSDVDQFGFVDLRAAFLNGQVPGDMIADDSKYNGIIDPDAVLHRSDDTFAAIRQATAVDKTESALKAAAAAAEAKPEGAASSSAAAE